MIYGCMLSDLYLNMDMDMDVLSLPSMRVNFSEKISSREITVLNKL